MKILPLGTKLFGADGQTDMTKLGAFHSFAKAPKNTWCIAILVQKKKARTLSSPFYSLRLVILASKWLNMGNT